MDLFIILKVLLSWGISHVLSLSEEKFFGFQKNPVNYCIDVELTQREGTISSPFYPNNYPSHLSCGWHLKGNIGEVITITIGDLDIEESCCCSSQPCCSKNWLKIGPTSNGTEQKLCGKGLEWQPILQSSGNKLYIKFHVSYLKDGGRGFSLHYKIGPKSIPTCRGNEFKCDNNQCVPSVVRCNTYPDCEDGSDEKHCSNRCASGRSCRSLFQCYDTSQHCDGIADCPDFSDEIDCGFCARNQTRCGINSTKCYNPLTQRCDRVFDCVNGEDEVDCSSMCPGKIMCESKRGCYSVKQRCNGITQCEDASDERHCVSELCNYERGGFLCGNGRCIQEVWTCDRTDDCGDGTDEKECLRNSVLTAALMGSLICALLLVIAISCTCRLHALRMLESRLTTTRETPLSRMSREFFFREPPPSYAVAVQGDPHRNLCVENLHYAVPVHRGRRSRSRRSRHSRIPYLPPTGPASPVRTAPSPPINEVNVEMVDETITVSRDTGQENKDSNSTSGQESKEDNVTDCCENVNIGGKRIDTEVNSLVEDIDLGTLVATSTDTDSSHVVSSETYYYCDSDTDPLVV